MKQSRLLRASRPRGLAASKSVLSSTSVRRDLIDDVYRQHSRRVLATLIRLLRDFDIAEEALHDAFVAAMERWPNEGVPRNPVAWLVSAGRFKAIDKLRRRAHFDERLR